MTITCDAAVSDLVLQAAQAAVQSPEAQAYLKFAPRSLAGVSERNRPLVPLLETLLDAADAVACAIADNAWDESRPMDAEWVKGLRSLTHTIGVVIQAGAECPDRTKELV